MPSLPPMTPMTVTLDVAANPWTDLLDKGVLDGALDHVGALPRGTSEGKPAVAVRVTLPDGTVVIGQTTLALFLTAADAFLARYGDPRT